MLHICALQADHTAGPALRELVIQTTVSSLPTFLFKIHLIFSDSSNTQWLITQEQIFHIHTPYIHIS